MKVTVARENMTLDLVVWQATGRADVAIVEQAVALNPAIAGIGAVLPVGTTIEIPALVEITPTVRDTVRLW